MFPSVQHWPLQSALHPLKPSLVVFLCRSGSHNHNPWSLLLFPSTESTSFPRQIPWACFGWQAATVYVQTSGVCNGSLCALTAHWRGGDELQKVQSLAEDPVLQKNEKRKKKKCSRDTTGELLYFDPTQLIRCGVWQFIESTGSTGLNGTIIAQFEELEFSWAYNSGQV